MARVNDGANIKPFTDLGIHAMSPTAASVMVLENLLRRSSTLRLMSDIDAGKLVREVTLHNLDLDGRALKNVRLEEDVLIAMIRRSGALFVPHGRTTFAVGDQLTLIGASEDVELAARLFERRRGARVRAVAPDISTS